MRAIGPISQLDVSGPRNGLVRSAALVTRGAEEPQARAEAMAAERTRPDAVLRIVAKQIKEFLPHLFLMEDAAQRRGDGQRPGLLHAAHLDAEVARLDDHHRPERVELRFETADDLLGQPLLQL